MADNSGLDFVAFIQALQETPLRIRHNDTRWRDSFRREFHTELALVCHYMHELGVLGGEAVEFDGSEKCDFCVRLLTEYGFFVDGVAANGAWASMCPQCYMRNGTGIGWGVGQLYRQVKKQEWQLVAGNAPEEGFRR